MSVNNVKCVLDVNGYALYFSRALIPHNKKGVYDPSVKYMRKVGNDRERAPRGVAGSGGGDGNMTLERLHFYHYLFSPLRESFHPVHWYHTFTFHLSVFALSNCVRIVVLFSRLYSDFLSGGLTFSRWLPGPADARGPFRALGIYSYRADFLPKFIKMPESNLQKSEDLEQNKVIEAGYRIKVGIVTEAVHGVDTPEQLDDLNRMLASGEIQMTNA